MKQLLMTGLMMAMSSLCVATETIHWGYDQDISAEHWGQLSDQFKACGTGQNQTPINIENAYKTAVNHKISIRYNTSPHAVVFNGHTIQVNTIEANNNDYIVVDHKKFFLRQFHFHTPSENQINGKNFPLEVHFVNVSEDGHITVLAVMFEIGPKSAEWDSVWSSLSKQENDSQTLVRSINLNHLLPKTHAYYRFSGSLTTPPCTEGVNWIVFKQKRYLSQTQLDEFKSLLVNQHNNRPIQPTNGRIIIED